jgi:hypothetical protein
VCSDAGNTGWKQGDELMTDSHSLCWKFARTKLLGEDLKVNYATLLDCFGNAESQLGCDPTYELCSTMKNKWNTTSDYLPDSAIRARLRHYQ